MAVSTWRILEDGVRYTELANKQAVFGGVANILVSIFRSLANKDIDQLKNDKQLARIMHDHQM